MASDSAHYSHCPLILRAVTITEGRQRAAVLPCVAEVDIRRRNGSKFLLSQPVTLLWQSHMTSIAIVVEVRVVVLSYASSMPFSDLWVLVYLFAFIPTLQYL
jgi:hypothetical protein